MSLSTFSGPVRSQAGFISTGGGVNVQYGLPVTYTTAGVVTYTAADLKTGLILRDPNGAGRSDVTPTAALLVAAFPNCAINSFFEFQIRNDADAAETITLTAGSGVTLNGTMTIAQNATRRFRALFTAVISGSEAVTIYSY